MTGGEKLWLIKPLRSHESQISQHSVQRESSGTGPRAPSIASNAPPSLEASHLTVYSNSFSPQLPGGKAQTHHKQDGFRARLPFPNYNIPLRPLRASHRQWVASLHFGLLWCPWRTTSRLYLSFLMHGPTGQFSSLVKIIISGVI